MEKDSIIKAAVDLLGTTATDKITGISGVVTSVVFDLYGCVQGSLSQKADEKGAIPQPFWFDVSRLEQNREVERTMPVPTFAAAGAALAAYDKGPAEKPAPR